jgi:methyl-accepting chemotaxis protein
MIKDFAALIRIYRDKLALIMLILALPWAWAFFWVPWWVNAICLLLVPLAGLLLIFRVLPVPPDPHRESDDLDDPNLSEAQIRKMRKVSTGVNTLLSRWSQVSSTSRSSIEQVQTQVDDVIAYSESAVIEVTNNFINVTRKTRKQVEHALSLLERTKGNAEQGTAPTRSLPELIAAYESMLQQVTASLTSIAETAQQLERRHEKVRENLQHIDTLLDQLSAHDSQIGMMALNTSVSVGSGGADFVSMSDQIRTLSLESKALTRDIRHTLEEIRSQAQETYGAVRAAVQQARDAAQSADSEVGKLAAGMRENNREVAEALAQIGALGNEIQGDINNIIVALQFQDITQQKLQRLKHPMLTDLTASLRAIFDETRVLSGKLQGSGLVDAKRSSATPFRVSRSGEHADLPESGAPGANPPPTSAPDQGEGQPKPKGGDTVEIF